jgi:TolB-like protein
MISPPSHAAEPLRLAILPFQLNSPEDLSYLQKGIQDMLSSRVVQGGKIEVVDRAAVAARKDEYGSGLDLGKAASLGKKMGADFLVFGSISKLGSHVSLDGEVVDVRSGGSKGRLAAEAPNLDGVIPQVSRLAQEIRGAVLGQPVARAQAAPAAGPPVAGLPQQQLVPAAPGAMYPVPPGGYPVPPGGFTGREGDLFSTPDEPVGPGGRGSLNPAFIMSYQADKAYRGFIKSPDLGLSDIQAVDVGDTDGDGTSDTVIVDEDRIYIYKDVLGDATKRLVITPMASRAKILSVDVADVNRNGRAEIYITAIQERGEQLASQVVEYVDGKYQVIAQGLPYLLRVTRSLQEGPILFGQEKRPRMVTDRISDSLASPFGPSFRLRWEGGKLAKGEDLPLKEDVCVLGITLVDVDRDGIQEYLAFDSRDYLKLFNAAGGSVWVSSEPYGRTGNYFLRDFVRKQSPVDDPQSDRIWLPPRILTVDIDGDGFDEVILCNNYEPLKLLPQSRLFSRSAIFSLSWDGVDFMENWRTREMKGYVSDYQVKDVDGDGKPDLLVGLVYKRGTMDYLKTTVTLIAFQLNVEKVKGVTGDQAVKPGSIPKSQDKGSGSLFPEIKF